MISDHIPNITMSTGIEVIVYWPLGNKPLLQYTGLLMTYIYFAYIFLQLHQAWLTMPT